MRAYLTKRRCSRLFIRMFLQALEYWFHGDLSSSLASSSIFQHQSDIGWRLLTRGFWTKRWRQYLEDTHPDSLLMTENDFTQIIAGAIKTVWQSVGSLWLRHLHRIHDKKNSSSSPLNIRDLQAKIRWMHAKRYKLPPENHAYFHDDVDAYLLTANEDSMRRYISQYYHVIEQAVRRQSGPSVSSTDAYSTTTSDDSDNSDSESGSTPSSHHAQGEPSHRKHRRRRIATPLHQRITNWFKPRTTLT